ncbi:MAG TPA: GDSL-type esterase/lipase family protein [Solirubrobacteraceae bacterium]|nr:GDSL-type esterase/lipase family protein [Solirubrobacteraceae bacterium]
MERPHPIARRAALLVAGVLGLALAGAPTPALAGPGAGPTAVVALGDSYISGEAGRWSGNSIDPLPGNDGTDRACVPGLLICLADKTRVYVGGSAADGCHRSDISEIVSAHLALAAAVNLACSGAVTANVLRASNGGAAEKGEAPQDDQLAAVARTDDVRMIVLSIGGNDLGFAGIVTACFEAYLLHQGPCAPAQQQALDQRRAAAILAVERVIDDVRAVMAGAGYAPADYRLVAQTYPSVVPRASDARYAEADPRRITDGCPFYDQDLNWAHDRAAPEIGDVVRAAAAARGVAVLDLLGALTGHEICARTDAEATPLSRPAPARSEWGRFVGASTILEGDLQEAFHPNAYAQLALGRCLSLLAAAGPGDHACTGAAGLPPTGMALAPG